jgi:Flp pilus assembly protein TadG
MRKFLLSNSAWRGEISKPMTIASRALRARVRAWRSLLKDRSGVSAVEFAIIAPVMIVLFFGFVETTVGVAIDRKLGIAAAEITQIVNAKFLEMDADLDDALAGLAVMLQPYDASTATATVSEISIDPVTGAATVAWSRGPDAPDVSKFPAGFPSGFYIMTEAHYLYVPWATAFFVPESGIPLTEIAISPTRNQCVIYNGAACP